MTMTALVCIVLNTISFEQSMKVMQIQTMSCRLRNQAGVGMVEVLVSLLVLSIGLLGLAALQAQSLRFTSDAYLRSQSTVLASDLIDRIRANRDSVDDYVAADLGDLYTKRALCDPTVATVDNDLQCWLLDVGAALPGTVPTVTTNGTDASFIDITMSWVDREPRGYTGEASARLPKNADECTFPDGDTSGTQLAARSWDAANTRCLVTQVWTVLP